MGVAVSGTDWQQAWESQAKMAEATEIRPVNGTGYYAEYHGHPIADLTRVHSTLRQQGKQLIFLAGDSSLDNKFWFRELKQAVNGYEHVLTPPRMNADVCYWLNLEASKRAIEYSCINTAIEATCLNDRSCGSLLEQDEFIRDNITEDDILVVSVGGNDVAMQPLCCTICSMCGLVYCGGPQYCIDKCSCACPPNNCCLGDLGCMCCGLPNSVTSTLCGWPLGIGYMVDLFKNRVENYVRNLVSGPRKPKKVMVCMIYFLDEQVTGSWADCALGCLQYNTCPGRLQAGIRAAFELATKQITIPGTEVVAFPLFEVLDGKNTTDYCQRVEPSPGGGSKMATAIMDELFRASSSYNNCTPPGAQHEAAN